MKKHGESAAPLLGARYDTAMRSRAYTLALLFVGTSLALPVAAHAGGIPFFGPIIPSAYQACPASWGLLVTVINNIISFLITLAIVFVAPLMIAYSGFLFVVNPMNAGGKEKAKSILTNTVVGIVIALSGWLIVDAIMAVLYNPGAAGGTWSSLITSGGIDPCIPLAGNLVQVQPSAPDVSATPPTSGTINGFVLGCTTSNDQNANELASRGVSGQSTASCCTKSQSTCTSLDGMLPSTIQQIENVQTACGGATVTGGTETGHANEGGQGSHSGGSKVDIGQNLISCILGTSQSSAINPPTFGISQVKDKCGNIYTWEGNHTDIYVQSACTF